MPESIFKQISLDILRLHQHTIHSLLATQCCNDTEVYDAVYVTLDGRYYVWLQNSASIDKPQTGILLIEDEVSQSRLSWITTTREVKQKDSLYTRAISAIQRKMQRTTDKFTQAKDLRLIELTPQQGRLTTGNNDFSLSPYDLKKALYPATYQ